MQAGSLNGYYDENLLHRRLRHINFSQKTIPTERVSKSKLELLSYPKRMLTSTSLGDFLTYPTRSMSQIVEPSV